MIEGILVARPQAASGFEIVKRSWVSKMVERDHDHHMSSKQGHGAERSF